MKMKDHQYFYSEISKDGSTSHLKVYADKVTVSVKTKCPRNEENGKPNVEFELMVFRKAVERSERVERSKARIRAIQKQRAYEQKRIQMMRNKGMKWKEILTEFREKYRLLSEEKQKNFLLFLNREYLIPTAELEVITGLKDHQIKRILYKDGGAIDEEGN